MADIKTKRSRLDTLSLHCPDCGAPTRLLAMIPSVKFPHADQITYRCEVCSKEMSYPTLETAA
jgi:transposase-like protein